MTDETPVESRGTSRRYDEDVDGRHAFRPSRPPRPVRRPATGPFTEHPPYTPRARPCRRGADAAAGRPAPAAAARARGRRGPAVDPGPAQTVTCPECGSAQSVNLNRRAATDFCRRCDFPLFWVQARTTRDWNAHSEREALRRLPGTGGSQRLASAACPHCAELNYATAETCVRCGLSMHVAPPPRPVPAPYVPPPVFEPVIEPESGVPWWVWVAVGTALVAIAVLVLFLTGVL